MHLLFKGCSEHFANAISYARRTCDAEEVDSELGMKSPATFVSFKPRSNPFVHQSSIPECPHR